MNAMKPRLVLFLLCFSCAFSVCARAKTILPDACGDDGVKFDVKTEKNQPPPAPPAAGKAQIVFIENGSRGLNPTIRYGVDGVWAGANHGDSYFAITVDPGVHHLCVSVESHLKVLKKSVDALSMTAEPGKVYYFAASIGEVGGGGYVAPTMGPNGLSGGGMVMGGGNLAFAFTQLNQDEGQYRVKAWKLATWKSK